MKVSDLLSQYESQQQSPLEPAVVALDVSQPDRLEILQDPQDYPGVHVVELTVREYPQGTSPRRCSATSARSRAPISRSWRSGATSRATRSASPAPNPRSRSALEGKPRRETIEVDPTGRQVGDPVKVDPGSVGNNVYLTIDSKVQRVAETSLAQGYPRRAEPRQPRHQDGRGEVHGAGRRGRRARRQRRFGRRAREQSDVRPQRGGPAGSARRTTTR